MFKHIKAIYFALFLSPFAVFSQTHYCLRLGSTLIDGASKIVAGNSGNAFFTAVVGGPCSMNDQSADGNEKGMVLGSLDSTGTCTFLKKYSTTETIVPKALNLRNGNIAITFTFTDSLLYDNQLLSTPDGTSGIKSCVALHNEQGDQLFYQIISGNENVVVEDIVLVAQGVAVIAGRFTGTFTLEGNTLVSQGGEDYFMARIGNAQNIDWIVSGGSSDDEAITHLRLDNSGNMLASGIFESSIALGSTNLISFGEKDAFLSSVNLANGTFIWAASWGGSQNDKLGSVLQKDNFVWLTGSFSSELQCSSLGGTLSCEGGSDVYLIKVNAVTGEFLELMDFGGNGSENGTSLCISGNRIYLGGTHNEAFTVGNNIDIPALGASDVFILELNQAYEPVAGIGLGSAATDSLIGLIPWQNDQFIACGNFNGNTRFGNTSLSGKQQDVFFMTSNQELNIPPDLQVSTYHVGNSNLASNNINHLSVDALNRLWVSTADSGISVFDGDTWTNYNSTNSPLPNVINSSFHAADGKVYVGTPENGLFVYDGLAWTNYNTSNSQINSNNIKSITSKNPAIIWMGTPDIGCIRLNSTGFAPFNAGNSALASDLVVELDYDTNGGTWVGTKNGGICRFFAGSFTAFDTQNSNLPSLEVSAVHTDKNTNTPYAVTNVGVARYNGTNWELEDLGADFIGVPMNDFTTTPSAYVAAGGKKKGGHIRTPIVQRTVNTENLLFENEVIKVQSDSAANTFWMATASNGLVKIAIETPAFLKSHKTTLFYIAPNPAHSVINLQLASTKDEIQSLEVWDAMGRMLMHIPISGGNEFNPSINIEKLALGMYTVKARGKKGTYTSQFIKSAE